MKISIVGSTPDALGLELGEHFNTGDPVELLVGINKDLSETELAVLQKELSRQGLELVSPVELGTERWANTLRLVFRRPATAKDFMGRVAPALRAIGLPGIQGWKLVRD